MKAKPSVTTKNLLLAACLLALPLTSPAATYFWDADGTGPTPLNYGSGTLSTSAANWTLTGASFIGWTNLTTDTMQIGSNTGGMYTGGTTAPSFALTMSGTIALGQFVVSGNLSSGNTLTVTDGGNAANTLSFGGVSTIQNNSGSNPLIIDAKIIAAAGTGLFDSSIGTVVLTKDNTYIGGTTIQGGGSGLGGVLQVGNGGTTGALGSGTITFGSNLQTTAVTLRYNRNDAVTVANNINVSSTTTLGAIIQQSGSNTLKFTGTTALNNATATLTYNIGNNTQAIDTEVSGAITGVGKVAKSGLGTLLLSGSNSYTGTTIVTAGTLLVNGSLNSGSVVSVSAGATLGGSGTIGGNTSVAGVLSPGNSPGQITFSNNLTLTGTAKMEINSAVSPVQGTDYDAVRVGGTLAYGGNLTLSLASTITAGTYNLFDGLGAQGSSLTESGDFSSVVFSGGAYAGTFTETSGIWNATDINGSGQTFSFNLASGDLSVTPEPATWALCGLGLGAILFFRKRSANRA